MLKWNDLFLKGTIINLHCSIWRARLMLRPEDLGIEKSINIKEAFSFGCTRLAKKSAFDHIYEIERQVKSELFNNSIVFPLIKGARYVPEKKFKELAARMDFFKKAFNDEVDSFLERYQQEKDKMLPTIQEALIQAAKTTEDAEKAYQRVLDCYPGAGEVRYKFDLSWSVFSITASNTDLAEISEKESEEVKAVIRDMIVQLRDKLSDRTKSILKLVDAGGKLNKRTLDSSFQLISRLRDLNITKDETLEKQLKLLEKALKAVDKDSVDDKFIAGLQHVQDGLKSSIDDAVKAAEQELTKMGRRKIGGR